MILRGSTLHGERLVLREFGTPMPRPIPAPTPTIVALPQPTPSSEVVATKPLDADQLIAAVAALDADGRARVLVALAGDLQELRRRAADEGRRAGEAKALEDAEVHRALQQRTVEAFLGRVSAHFEGERAALNDACAAIVAEALVKLVGTTLATPEALSGAVRQAAQLLPPDEALRIRIHRDDLDLLEAGRAQLAELLPGREVELVADPQIDVGGCIVEGAHGRIDARWETQLSRMCDSLKRARSAQPAA